ncbi:5-dehydro-4-deoxy-D-glucuronate isomerase DhuI [Streptococcus uberis]|uniref:RpiB/LacA/LacB family sugar-phosphate isomerase n=1 Tax=Streptococcus uberis TaxID=1349 RepID=UPI00193A60E6|nr:RpiB/LacA/LacB family sugar-phosphate isomerase [Streptococcus uberis]MCK1160287.1 RpiB/LacA/LacB family sugar-phosphate isomerase [Streptococcus uberis]MCK1162073.1 RpiB/LacA/LacB family sugar-phosphate isomerase [Streptococcus uberis]MEE3699297.1 RpiB/LacA/LacB family sugar-phosphate isomerase [Streptococcus uberis]
MKIALINENSQATKNNIIFDELKTVAERKGFEVFNYGMYGNEGESQLTYVQNGLLTAILLNSGAADFVITGCGTGMGAMLACNSFPGVTCGFAADPVDAYLFSQVNGGNALSLPFAKGFGWGAELNLRYMFERLFEDEVGGGYPKERAIPEQRNARILNEVKAITYKNLLTILKEIDQEFLKETISGEHFQELFFANCQNKEIADYLKTLLNV